MVKLEWKHKRPVQYYKKCVEMFGEPTAISNKVNGFALWKTKGLFSEHLLRDEDVKHCVPRPHHDYFYSSVKFFVPKEKLLDVLRISGSINYDGLKKLLTARCGGIGANYATLYLGMCVANNKLTIDEVKSNDMYPKMIRGELIPHNELHKIMHKMKKENNKKYKKELENEFATYAYNKCYRENKNKSLKSQNRKTKKRVMKKNTTMKLKLRKGGNMNMNMNMNMNNSKIPMNTRNEKCSKNEWSSCCPHMEPDEEGRYRATNEINNLYYENKVYQLHTCCNYCAKEMNKESKANPVKFKNDYILGFDKENNMILKNKHTEEKVQIAKKDKKY